MLVQDSEIQRRGGAEFRTGTIKDGMVSASPMQSGLAFNVIKGRRIESSRVSNSAAKPQVSQELRAQ